MDSQIKAHLTDRGVWIRLVYMILFVALFYIAVFVIAVVIVVQFLTKLFTGKLNPRLQALGENLAAYVYEIIAYLTFHTDDMPYPFSPWPKGAPGAKPPVPVTPKRSRRKRARPAGAAGTDTG